MVLFKRIFITILFLIPILSIYYKVKIENISFIPVSSSNEWNIQVSYDLEKIFDKFEINEVELPLINSWHNQEVKSRQVTTNENLNLPTISTQDSITVKKDQFKKLSVSTRLKLADSNYGNPMRSAQDKANLKQIRKQYLKLGELSEGSLEQLKILNRKFGFRGDTPREKVRKIYLFITEEIIASDDVDNLSEVINLAEGSEQAKAQLMTFMARVNKIPARTNLAFKMEKVKGKTRLKKAFIPEVLIDNYWYPVSVNALTFTRVPRNYLIVHKDVDSILNLFTEDMASIRAAPIMINKVDSMDYTKKLSSVNKFFSMISLHNLPISMQSLFITVLLIPFGTLILSFCRNLVGVQTFGIFTPILLSLFFLETSLLTGAIFFLFIVALGFFQRYALDKLYLLAVPRLSILLTLVVISYSMLGLFSVQAGSFLQGGALSYFPIVIIVVFIERFSVHFIEQGAINTLKALFGTALVSLLCYFIFKDGFLRLALFNHPELLLFVIGGNMMIGGYKGYRLSELLRFREFKRVGA